MHSYAPIIKKIPLLCVRRGMVVGRDVFVDTYISCASNFSRVSMGMVWIFSAARRVLMSLMDFTSISLSFFLVLNSSSSKLPMRFNCSSLGLPAYCPMVP